MLANVDILIHANTDSAEPVRRAMDYAARLAIDLGAQLWRSETTPAPLSDFYRSTETVWSDGVEQWRKDGPDRLRIVLCAVSSAEEVNTTPDTSTVFVKAENWESEETLFARSGISDLLGDPARPPLVPQANLAAHSTGYSVFCAITSIAVAHQRFGQHRSAIVDALATMAWINWKAGAAGAANMEITREGVRGEWPVLKCKDGFVAFLFTERDWPSVVTMVGDARLKDEKYASFKGREADRDGYLSIIEEWLNGLTMREAEDAMLEYAIPGAPVLSVSDLPTDPLLIHRETLKEQPLPDGSTVTSPSPAYRVAHEATGAEATQDAPTENALPLAGLRVLDLGIITAGAGVSALLADLGADVIKVESETYPDPFRQWAGSAESPLFKFNNRNKRGIALDLKTDEGRMSFMRLARDADIVVENFRRGVLDRLGMTFEALRAENPNILLASISGQGLDGPGAGHTTFGSTLEANTGLASLTCYDDGVPQVTGRNLNYPDQIVCIYGAAMIALYAADCRAKGVARHLDISQRDCAIYQLGDIIAAGETASRFQVASGRGAVLKTHDGADAAFSATARAAIEGDIAKDGVTLADWASEHNLSSIINHYGELGVTQCLKGSQMVGLAEIQNADVFKQSPAGHMVKGFPFQFTDAPMTIHADAPQVGEQTEEVLAGLSLY